MDGLSGPHQTLKSALTRKHMVRAVSRHSDALKHLHRKMPHEFSAFPVAAGLRLQNGFQFIDPLQYILIAERCRQ